MFVSCEKHKKLKEDKERQSSELSELLKNMTYNYAKAMEEADKYKKLYADEFQKRLYLSETIRMYEENNGGKCEGCGQPKALNEVFCYVDDVNPAINYNSPYLCRECYEKRYGKNR